MNPILLKTLLSMASNNAQASASSKKTGMDAQMRTRTVLYPDEPVDLPRWGISALPSMILGAAPQTCLFVKDLTVTPADADQDSGGNNSPATPSPSPTSTAPTAPSGSTDDSGAKPASDTVSFSLALESPPESQSGLHTRQITWQLSMPVASYRDIKTSANSDSVRAPVIRTLMQLRGVNRDVEIGLLEMGGIDQPLLIGQDTLGDQFLIRPDRAPKETPHKSPSATAAPTLSEDSETAEPSNNAKTPKDAQKPEAETKNDQDNSTAAPAKDTTASSAATPENTNDTPLEAPEKQATPMAPAAPTEQKTETKPEATHTPQPVPEPKPQPEQEQEPPAPPSQTTDTQPTPPTASTTANTSPADTPPPDTPQTDASSPDTSSTVSTPAGTEKPAEPPQEPKPENT